MLFQKKAGHGNIPSSVYELVAECRKRYAPDFIPKSAAPDHAIQMVMSGIFLGDIIGMPYEGRGIPESEDADTIKLIRPQCTFTDDSVLSFAVLETSNHIKDQKLEDADDIARLYKSAYRYYAKLYPDRGYGSDFYNWAILNEEDDRYQSYGDGSAMRSGILGAVFHEADQVITHAVLSAFPTHAHEEGIKGSVVTAVCVWMALHGASKEEILNYCRRHYPDGYRTKEEWYGRPWMSPDISTQELIALQPATASVICQDAVPEAISNFVHSDSYESCIRNALRYACDSDTVGAISGGIAAAYYKSCDLPEEEEDILLALEKVCGNLWTRVMLA